MLLVRYGNLDYILKLEYKQGFKFIEKAINKDYEEKVYQTYIDLQIFKQMNYETYKQKVDNFSKNEDKSALQEEIEQTLDKVKDILGGI